MHDALAARPMRFSSQIGKKRSWPVHDFTILGATTMSSTVSAKHAH